MMIVHTAWEALTKWAWEAELGIYLGTFIWEPHWCSAKFHSTKCNFSRISISSITARARQKKIKNASQTNWRRNKPHYYKPVLKNPTTCPARLSRMVWRFSLRPKISNYTWNESHTVCLFTCIFPWTPPCWLRCFTMLAKARSVISPNNVYLMSRQFNFWNTIKRDLSTVVVNRM